MQGFSLFLCTYSQCFTILFRVVGTLIDELLIGSLDERAACTLVLGFESQLALLVVEVFIAFGSLHFAPEEDTHDGTHRGTILDVFDERIEFGCGQRHYR